ncbi:MAG: AAA-like domain-containing protein, partial [Leptolyngbyaceae cyanobacterium]
MAFVSGGTVQAGGGIYVSRQADQELLALCRSSAFAYVLTPRQMGKSSLMVRTAEVLKEQGIRTATVDLTKIGTQLEAEAWYLGLLTTIARPLGLVRQLMPWWKAHQHLGVTQRFTEFVEEILLTEITEQVVIFVDEIDTTLNLDFTDDFFIAIRSFYLARAENPDFTRLSFVLFGVATPSDLIRNPQRTPFNIGQRVDLTDFTFAEALPLAEGFNLPEADGQRLLQWVMAWTGGHPYLTQRLCGALAEENRTDWTEFAVAGVVSRIFLGAASKQDTNLQFVRDMLTRRSPDLVDGLTVYREVLQNRELVPDEEQSLVKSHLKLSGIVKRREEDAALLVRNPIYREVFDRTWIREHLPVNWVKQLRKAAIFSGAIFLVGMVPLAVFAAIGWKQAADRGAELEQALSDEKEQRQLAEERGEDLTIAIEDVRNSRSEANKKRIEAENAREDAEAAQEVAVEQRQQAEQARADEAEQRLAAVRARNQAETFAVAEAQQRRIADEQRTLAEQLALVAGLKEQSIRGQSYLDTARATEGLVLAMHATIESRSLPPEMPPEVATDVRSVTESALFEASEAVKERMIFRGDQANFSATAFSPDDELMASGDLDGNLRLWDMQGNLVNDFSDFHEGAVVAVAFTAEGRRIVSLGQNGIIKLWQRDGQLLEESETTTNFEILNASFSSDGQTVVASLADGSIATKSLDDQDWQEWLIAEPQERIINASLDETDDVVEIASPRLSGPRDRQSFTGNEGEIVSIEATSDNLEFSLVVRDDSGNDVAEGNSPIYATLPADGTYEVTTTPVVENEELISEPYHLRVNRVRYADEPIYQESGALEATDEIARGDRRQDAHKFQGQAGQEISIVLTSDEFDPYLRLENFDGEFIQEETDYIYDESTNLGSSFLRIKLPEDGTYRIIVTPFGSPEGSYDFQSLEGSYELQVNEGEYIKPLALEISGQLEIPVIRGDTYSIEGEKGQPFRVLTSSDERFTPYLQLRDKNGNIVLQNYGELNSSVPEDGTYQLEVISDSDAGGNYSLVVNPEEINDLSISPDGRYLATALSNGSIKLWNPEGTFLSEVVGQRHQGDVLAIDFSANGDTIVSGGQDGTIRLWNLAGEAIRDPLRGHNGDVLAVEFSSDNQRIVSSGRDGTIRLWSMEGRGLGQPLRGHAGQVTSVQFSHDDQHVISRGRDQTIRVWAADVNVPFQGHSGEVIDAAFSPNGKLIVSSGLDGTIRLWNLKGRQVDSSPFIGHEADPDGFEGVINIAFSPSGDLIASAGADGTIRLWDLQGNQIGEAFTGHEADDFGSNGVIDVTFSPDGQSIASSGFDGTIRLWDLQGNQIGEAFTGHEEDDFDEKRVVGLAYSPDGQRLASSGRDGTIRHWEMQGKHIG